MKRTNEFAVGLAVLLALGLVWLAFLPNACYLLTEWRHFLELLNSLQIYQRWQARRDSSAMLQLTTLTLFFFCYSSLGMLAFTLAIRPVVRVLRQYLRTVWPLGIPFFTIVSLGVYLGLVLRYNSWDLLHRPSEVWFAMLAVTMRPALFAMVIAFGLFLWLAYVCIDIWIDGFLLRWQRRSAAQQSGQ
jgi:uncharacterized membrane protein